MRSWLLVTACCVGCWTGSPPASTQPTNSVAAAPERPLRFRIKLERTACLGRCPVYSVVIHGDGRVQWNGMQDVAAMGVQEGHVVTKRDVERLVRIVRHARFFERDNSGELQAGPVCTTVNGTTTCSYSAHFCSDTSHSKITVTLDGQTHTIDNDHCDTKPELDELESAVDQLAGAEEYVGR